MFEDGDADICTRDPVDIWNIAHMRDLVEVWLGHRSLAARADGSIESDGDRVEIGPFANGSC